MRLSVEYGESGTRRERQAGSERSAGAVCVTWGFEMAYSTTRWRHYGESALPCLSSYAQNSILER